MVAYSFQPRFLGPIRSGEKTQTIRLPRKRHARPGEALQIFTGPRMRPTRVGGAVCQESRLIRLDFAAGLVILDDAITIEGDEALSAFAISDGFRPPERHLDVSPWAYMGRWWGVTHPDQPVFSGALITWGSTFQAVP